MPKKQRRVNPPSNGEHDANVVPGEGEGEAEAEAEAEAEDEDARPNSLPQTPRKRHAPHVVLTTQVSRAVSRQGLPRQPELNPTTPKRARQTVRAQQPPADANKIPSAPPPKPDSHISTSPQPGGQLQLSENNPESLTAVSTSSVNKTAQGSTKTIKNYIKRTTASVKKHQEQLNEELDEAAKMAEEELRTLTVGLDQVVSEQVKMAEARAAAAAARAAAAAAREFSLIQEKKVQDLEIEQLNRQIDELTTEVRRLMENRRVEAPPNGQ